MPVFLLVLEELATALFQSFPSEQGLCPLLVTGTTFFSRKPQL